jgi:EmrB/QacA subfamily drug resistance transporter
MLKFAPGARLASQQRRWFALVVVCLAQLMNTLDTTIVNVALPTIQADLHFTQATLTWVVNAYLISYGSFLLLAGRLGDLVGRKRVFLAGVLLFTTASTLCGVAHDPLLLVAARFIQGIGGAVSSSVIVAIIVTEFGDPMARARAMSTYVFVAVGGGSIGLLLGGALTQSVDWHWIFFINVPIGIVAALLGRALIKENDAGGLSQGVDVVGSILVTTALMVGIYAIVESPAYGWASAETLGLGVIAIGLLAAFAVLQVRLEHPLMPPQVLRVSGLLSSSVVRGLVATGMFASFFFSALLFQRIFGFGPMQTGLAFLPMTITVGTLSLGITARMVTRFGPLPTLSAGMLSMIGGLGILARTDAQSSYFPVLLIAFGMIGFGAGSSFMPLLTIGLAEVAREDAGLASGIINVSMQISAALGLAVLGSLAANHSGTLVGQGLPLDDALVGGYQLAFTIGAICVATGLLAAQVLLRRPAPAEHVEPEAREPYVLARAEADWPSEAA